MDNEFPDRRRAKSPWSTLIVAVTILGISAFGFLSWREPWALAGKMIDLAPEIARNFKTGNITHTFFEETSDIHSTQGDVLEIATLKATETFSRSDSKSIIWNSLYLGTTISEIKVPVTFRYHIILSDPWRLASKDHVCIALTPPISASLPPAIDTEAMQKTSTAGWARFNKEQNLADLEKGITPELEKRAGDSQHINLVREQCRQSVAAFIKRWLLKDEYWQEDRFSAIIVYFPDEIAINSDSDLEHGDHPPTITLQ